MVYYNVILYYKKLFEIKLILENVVHKINGNDTFSWLVFYLFKFFTFYFVYSYFISTFIYRKHRYYKTLTVIIHVSSRIIPK